MPRNIVKTRVRVWHDDGTEVDLSDRVITGPVVAGDIDAADYECSITFDNAHDYVSQNLSLEPEDQLSTLNQDGSSANDPILTENHEVQVDYDTGSGWVVLFQGYCGADVDSLAVDSKMHTVLFAPFGVTQPIKERDRLVNIVYKDRDLATSLLRSILMDSGFLGKLAHVVIADDPYLQVTEYITKTGSTWDALQTAIEITGYILSARHHAAGVAYDDGSGESTPEEGFYLTLVNPLRDKTVPDHTWAEECKRRNVRSGLEDVRTSIEVVFELSNGAQKITTAAKDEAARAKYGTPAGDGTKLHRVMRLVLDNNSPVRTLAGAERLRDYAAHDLGSPSPGVAVDLDVLWAEPQLNELVEFQFLDYTMQIGITGVVIDLSPALVGGRTTYTGVADMVIGLRGRWLSGELTEEERQRQRLEWLEGGMTKLPTPQVLSFRRWAYQTRTGETRSAMSIRWARCKAYWYGYTAVYLSYEDQLHYPVEPTTTSRSSSVTIDPLPHGVDVYFKLRNFPAISMSPQGRR